MGREGLDSRCLTVVGPRGQQGFVHPSPTRSLPEAPPVPGASGPAERASPAQPASSLRTRPERGAPAQAHFRKSLSSRHPQPDTHAAVTRDSGRLRDALVARGEMHFTDRAFTIKAPEPGLGTGLSFPPEKGERAAGLSRGAGRGLTRVPASEPSPPPHPTTPSLRPPPGAPRSPPRPGATGGQQLPGGATSPRLAPRGLSLTVGFYLQPAALLAPAPGQPQPAPEKEGEPGAGRATLADPRGERGTSGEGPARAVSRSVRASERGG